MQLAFKVSFCMEVASLQGGNFGDGGRDNPDGGNPGVPPLCINPCLQLVYGSFIDKATTAWLCTKARVSIEELMV